MSDKRIDDEVSGLMKLARGSIHDANSLWEIAGKLEQIGAWVKAREVERMAEKAEKECEEVYR